METQNYYHNSSLMNGNSFPFRDSCKMPSPHCDMLNGTNTKEPETCGTAEKATHPLVSLKCGLTTLLPRRKHSRVATGNGKLNQSDHTFQRVSLDNVERNPGKSGFFLVVSSKGRTTIPKRQMLGLDFQHKITEEYFGGRQTFYRSLMAAGILSNVCTCGSDDLSLYFEKT